MTLNTYIAGKPAVGHALAEFLHRRADSVHDKATAWHDARKTAEADWDGAASEAFIANRALPNGRDADALADINRALARPFTAWADGITAAEDWMDRAKEVARGGDLVVLDHAIYPPKAFEHLNPSGPLDGQALVEYEAAKAEHAKKQAAFTEAQALVQQARDLERQAHDQLRDALTKNTDALKQLEQFQQWSQAARSASTPAATELMSHATELENKAVHAAHAAFERAAAQGPYATNSMWSALTSEQRADLIARHPHLVGNTNGIPAADRDLANRSILAAQRQALVAKIEEAKREYHRNAGTEHGRTHADTQEFEQALKEIDELRAKLGDSAEQSGYYLLGLDSTANDRGTAIIAHGNPDTAHNTMTLVPGTSSDLGDVGNYVAHNDKVLAEAEGMTPQNVNNVAITWASYESPLNLPLASDGSYAEDGNAALTDFQEGLRATHQGDVPSHNTVIGHSYGSTLVGEASANGGTHADEIVFLGSPGVGVDHASELDVPADHVWGGTSRSDEIHGASSLNPFDLGNSKDDHWFGVNPGDPAFGGKSLTTDPATKHGEYWDKATSREAMARVMTGKGGS